MKLSNVAIVTMRTSSTRLPKKSLADITNTKKSIDIIIERAKLTGLPVVFATSSDESDDQIADIAKSHGVVIFRGALLNKLKRWNDCFEQFEIENALLIDGDDLCYDYDIGKKAMNDLKTSEFDVIWCPDEIITGLFTLALTKNAIKTLYSCEPSESFDADLFTHLFKKTNLRISYIELEKNQKNMNIRLTLDYEKDLLFFRELYSHIPTNESGNNIVKFIVENPKIASINYQCQQDFLNNKKLKMDKKND
tara:strand:- start:10917 stop:11669 length:753 start_codon:yes stop_codon:yes gene_type:complete